MTSALKYCFILCLSLTTGCTGWKFYEIESTYRVDPSSVNSQPDITESNEYAKLIPAGKTIAVSASGFCMNETHSQSSGINTHQDTLLRSRCGLEMSYIERALIDQGFRVISWNVIDDGARIGPNTTIQVASNLGADLVLVISSLERTMNTGTVTEWQRHYFMSDKHDSRGMPIERSDSRRISEAVVNV